MGPTSLGRITQIASACLRYTATSVQRKHQHVSFHFLHICVVFSPNLQNPPLILTARNIPYRRAGIATGIDSAFSFVTRLALDVLKKWNPLRRSPISQQADGLCPAASARSALGPVFRYVNRPRGNPDPVPLVATRDSRAVGGRDPAEVCSCSES